MISIPDFLSKDKSMIIAPAGYGKTHTIVDCIEQYEGEKKILVLTHTHAGVASIKDKVKKRNILGTKCHIETICSFALNLANDYHINKSDFPLVEDGHAYFDFAIECSIKSLKNNAVKSVIRSQYSHLIVDEYQDCSIEQHSVILHLSSVLKTHILGDPLQGIFNFRGTTLIDIDTEATLSDYRENIQELTVPWRWNNNNASSLGRSLADIRDKLISNECVDLNNYSAIEVVVAPSRDIHQPRSNYKNRIWREVNYGNGNLLIIHPVSSSEAPRENIIKEFPVLRMIEALDNQLAYNHCKELDNKTGAEIPAAILVFICRFSNETNVKKWIKKIGNGWRTVKKTLASDKPFAQRINNAATKLTAKKTILNIYDFYMTILEIPGLNCKRKGLIYEIIAALKMAQLNQISIYEAMKSHMDKVRRNGRKIIGKCIGTTLLTKGLECDTVIVLDAHKFRDSKNLYVALTRACKKLIVFTENTVLGPY